MNASRAANRVEVTLGGKGVTSRAGLVVVAELADRLGLTKAMSAAMSPIVKRRRRRDPGVALAHVALLLADGGDCLSDLAVLRDEPDLFGVVASDSTALRALESGWATEAIIDARRVAREAAWSAGAAPETTTLDIDATLLDAHSDKEDAAATYKGGYGFHPLICFLDETTEALAGELRSGNAGANSAQDHREVLDAAISQLPGAWRAGHERGDDSDAVMHRILVRADSAGATHDFVDELIERNCEFSIGFQIDQKVRDALLLAQEEDWVPAIERDGTIRDGAFVTEVTEYLDLSRWGDDIRCFSRRERPHPGAQLSFFDIQEGMRHQCFITNSKGDAAQLELRHRGHARVEDRIRDAKAMGMRNLPFRDVVPNNAWFQLVLCAMDLIAWTKALCLEGELAIAEPKRLRYALLHCAGRIVHSARRVTVRVQEGWPWQDQLVAAFTSVRAIELC
jgi:hypothetical protein